MSYTPHFFVFYYFVVFFYHQLHTLSIHSLSMCTNISILCLISNIFFLASQNLIPSYPLTCSFCSCFNSLTWNSTFTIPYLSTLHYLSLLYSTKSFQLPHTRKHSLLDRHKIPLDNYYVGLILPKGYVKYSLSEHFSLSDSASTPAVWVMSKGATGSCL